MELNAHHSVEGQMLTDSLACGSVLATLLAGAVSVLVLLM